MIINKLPASLLRSEIKDFSDLTPHQVVLQFESLIANFFGAPYCVSTDSCTHALELCLRLHPPTNIVSLTKWTYVSIPMLLEKLNISFRLVDFKWKEFYNITDTVIDAAVLWRENSYIPKTTTCISFQHKKHCPIGRGGAILLDCIDDYNILQKMVADGRDRNLLQVDDNISTLGYHYYMTPEDAARGIKLFEYVKDIPSSQIDWRNYKDLTLYDYYQSNINS